MMSNLQKLSTETDADITHNS